MAREIHPAWEFEPWESEPPPIFDLNDGGVFGFEDLGVWVKDLKGTWFGDANLDGEFDSADLVSVWQAGQYEDGIPHSTWATGDWNGDSKFTTSDLVLAFQDGGYEQGPRAGANGVPEPRTMWLAIIGAMVLSKRLPRRESAIEP